MTTINIKESLKAPPDRVFQVLTVDDVCSFSYHQLIEMCTFQLVRKWSNSKVSIDLKEGGQFSLFDGMVCGTFTTIVSLN
jgi:activator of HSP90 ATPase